MIFPLFAKQTKTVAVPRAWGQPPFLSVLQTKAGRAGGAEQGRGQKTRRRPPESCDSGDRCFSFKRRQLPTLPHCIAVPSAQVGLTSLFGMGRGGTPPQ